MSSTDHLGGGLTAEQKSVGVKKEVEQLAKEGDPVKASVVTNSAGGHGETILAGIMSATRIIIHVAFLNSSGLKFLGPALRKAIEAGVMVEIVAGLDSYVTEPKALRTIYDLMANRENAVLLLAKNDRAMFHPKFYYWEKDGHAMALVGSANMTNGGLKGNMELSIVTEGEAGDLFFLEVQGYIDSVKASEGVSKATLLSMSQYERRYSIFAKKRREAEKEAAAETPRFGFDEKKLEKYLKEYNQNKEKQVDFNAKRAKYQRAKKLLDSLTSEKIKNKDQFLDVYEQLVGAKGKRGLWHSGGLFRSKYSVANCYDKFLAFLAVIKAKMEETPDVIMESVLPDVRNINGMGLNVLTETMNTYAPKRFSVLNRNPVTSLACLGFEKFGSLGKHSFSGRKYSKFNNLILELARLCEFDDLSQVDHFLDFVYWKTKPKKATTS